MNLNMDMHILIDIIKSKGVYAMAERLKYLVVNTDNK